MPAKSTAVAQPLTSAGDLFLMGEKVDGRSLPARRYRDLFNDLALQSGGLIAPSEGMMLRRASMLAVLCERDEARMIAGEDVDEEGYRRNVAALKGVLIGLGLAKKSRDVTKGDSRFYDAHTAAILEAE